MAASKTLSPEQRRERARRAGKAAHSLDSYVRQVVDRAPELTPEQIDKLKTIFGSAAR